MAALYSHTTRSDGTVLTATIYNADHQSHIDNGVPAQQDDYSVDVAQMKLATDPGEVGTESLATSLAGEIERLRFLIKEIHGGAQWYSSPAGSTIANPLTTHLDGGGFDITSLGTLSMTEQAEANADVAGEGQWWVDDLSPNVPMFTDDDGTDGTLSRLEFAQEYTKAQNFNATTLSSTSNAVAWAAVANQVTVHVLTEDTTISAPSGLNAGGFYTLRIVQHASAAKTVAYNAVFKFAGNITPIMSVGVNAIDIMTFYSPDGTNMEMVGLVQNLS